MSYKINKLVKEYFDYATTNNIIEKNVKTVEKKGNSIVITTADSKIHIKTIKL